MILTIQQANKAQLVGHYDGVVTIYVRQYGAGNLRLGTINTDLENTAPPNAPPGQVVDGIPQAAAANIQQYFWSGDLWVISDNAGDKIMILAPAYSTYVNRVPAGAPRPADLTVPQYGGNLSTYS